MHCFRFTLVLSRVDEDGIDFSSGRTLPRPSEHIRCTELLIKSISCHFAAVPTGLSPEFSVVPQEFLPVWWDVETWTRIDKHARSTLAEDISWLSGWSGWWADCGMTVAVRRNSHALWCLLAPTRTWCPTCPPSSQPSTRMTCTNTQLDSMSRAEKTLEVTILGTTWSFAF